MTTQQESYNRYKKYSTDLRRYYRLPAVQASLSVVLSLFISAFFILLAIRPTLITITTLNSKIEESEKTLDQLEVKANALTSVAKTWSTVEPLLPFIDNAIPTDGPRYQSLTKSMEILASETGVILGSENIGDALVYSKVADPYTGTKRSVITTPFTIRVSGSYPSIREFFTKLTTMDRLVIIEGITFTKDAKAAQEQPGVTFTVSGSVTYLADESKLVKILESAKDD